MNTPLLTLERAELDEFLQSAEAPKRRFCQALEEGRILFFPQIPFPLPQPDVEFLLGQKQTAAKYHKNIAYRPKQHRVTGAAERSGPDQEQLLEIMGRFSRNASEFLRRMLPPYAALWRLDYASFRPQEELGRRLKLTARNDLLHVDAFPTRPTRGDRILRFFTNINPEQSRRWITSESFPRLIEKEAAAGLPLPPAQEPWIQRAGQGLRRAAAVLRVLPDRSRYDNFMLSFHDYLKKNDRFQRECPKFQMDFPPGSSWVVFTDSVPHAALSGRFALEQTFIVSRDSLVCPELAPINILEKLCGVALAR